MQMSNFKTAVVCHVPDKYCLLRLITDIRQKCRPVYYMYIVFRTLRWIICTRRYQHVAINYIFRQLQVHFYGASLTLADYVPMIFKDIPYISCPRNYYCMCYLPKNAMTTYAIHKNCDSQMKCQNWHDCKCLPCPIAWRSGHPPGNIANKLRCQFEEGT